LQQKQQDLQNSQKDTLGYAAAAIKNANYDPVMAHGLLDSMPQTPQLAQIRQQIDNPQMLKQIVDGAIAQSPAQQKMLGEQKVAQIRANTPDAQMMNSWLQQNPGKTPADYQQFKVNQGVQADVAKETNPQVIAAKEQLAASEARARQAVQDGDPRSAAQLLISGDIAPSQIISARKPEFAQQAFQAAHDLSGGQWNAQQADANFNVAKSPQNVAFFGSAKSLTDPGGTLDQLKQIGKTLPQNQLPVLNTIEDWEKAQTGSGPVAKFASAALGVADDYAKVMGGGQGTDTSRLQILKTIAASQSPEQLEAALEGIRGVVGSQINSRIGSNPVMRKMYGQQATQQQGQQPFSHVSASGKYGWDGTKWVPTQGGQQ
jgi:hypothetical protein